MFKDEKITVIKSNKLNKATKQSLVQIWRKNYTKYELLETEFSSLKNEYEKKINELGIIIKKILETLLGVYKKQTVDDALEKKVNLQHESLIELENDFIINLKS